MKYNYQKLDPFPNLPSLSKRFVLYKGKGTYTTQDGSTYRGYGPFKQQYFSICSKHAGDINIYCDMCNCGTWNNCLKNKISHFFYKLCPNLWVWCVNCKWRKWAFLKSTRSL